VIPAGDADAYQVRIPAGVRGARSVAINTTDGEVPEGTASTAATPTGEKTTWGVVTRAGWGANEMHRFDRYGNEEWPQAFYPAQKLTVHHTAGINDDPDPAATVRAIYRFHAIDRGWGDIGYHYVVAPDGRVFAVTGSATPQQLRSVPRSLRRQAGRVFDVSGGNLTSVARVDRLEHTQNLDNVRGDRNSNPYAILALADRQIVVDAGANAVLQVQNGQVSLLALIPNRRGGRRQSVPSSIALGPDGAYYVGELAESSGRGKARVWRIPAEGGTATVYRSGFTTISGVAFGPDGSLYVTEFARNFRTFAGRLVRVAADGTRTVLAGGRRLKAPTGAAVDSSGAVYVSNFSVLPRRTPRRSDFRGAGGTLVKITP
jgi:hypothetical protein